MEDPIDAIKAGPGRHRRHGRRLHEPHRAVPRARSPTRTRSTGRPATSTTRSSSASLTGQVTGVAEWHINSDEPDVLDYDTTFKPPAQEALYEPNAYRSSDHDPIIVGLRLNAGPTVDANGPYTVGEGGSVSLSATGTDPNGDTLTYAWDLDNNGSYETPGQTVTFSAALIDGARDAHRRRAGLGRDGHGDGHRAGDDHERGADGDVRRPGDGRRGQPVHARADEPGRSGACRRRCRLHVRVRLRLGLRAVRCGVHQELPDVERRCALGGREDPRQGRRRHRVPRVRPGGRDRGEPLRALRSSSSTKEGVAHSMCAKLRERLDQRLTSTKSAPRRASRSRRRRPSC